MSPMYLQPAFLPDGRTVVAGYHETFGWTLRLGDIATEGPDLRVLLEAALEDHPEWVKHVHDELAGRDIGSARRWPCACCGCFTHSGWSSSAASSRTRRSGPSVAMSPSRSVQPNVSW
jgi:hypothetical protein